MTQITPFRIVHHLLASAHHVKFCAKSEVPRFIHFRNIEGVPKIEMGVMSCDSACYWLVSSC